MMTFSDRQNRDFMQLALAQGRKGLGNTSPNPPVGAVIVDAGGMVLGKGFHLKAGAAHAEIAAIENVTQHHGRGALRGATLYVTLEPCSTTGKTPPCCDAIVAAGISTVYAATADPWPGHQGRAEILLSKSGVHYSVGLLQQEADELLRFFRKRVVSNRPWVIAKSAITLSGSTVLPKHRGQWISSPESRDDVQRLRRQCDAIMVGGATVRQDDPMLTLRGDYALGRDQPERIVVTQSNDIPKGSKLLIDQHKDRTSVFHNRPLKTVLETLAKRGKSSVLLESGGNLFAHALEQGLVDEVVLYIAPIIGGDKKLLEGTGILADLKKTQMTSIGCDIRVRGMI